MGEITSINKATSTNASLRTTIPRSIVNQFGLTYNDKLEWILKAEGGELVIQVKPIKSRECE
ncbi:AbrB family transcriptional regulator [Candidatus Bathyarchaeota archaeon]|nr:AbrB family transcriptional regulator [Candidatus Bathyarchaeota archaeon]